MPIPRLWSDLAHALSQRSKTRCLEAEPLETKENLMNLALWIAAGLLALVALGGGISKTFVPKEKLEKRVASGWVKDVSPGLVRALGVLELLAAVGLILPAVVDIAPVLVPVTAVCLVLLMVGAVITHVRYHDGAKVVVVVSIYLALAAFIAWGRFGPESFTG
jgi:hypothetical protein